MTTQEQKAMEWWDSMNFQDQFFKTIGWLVSQDRGAAEKHPHQLTTEDIVNVFTHNH